MIVTSTDLIGRHRWSRVHRRAFEHKGCVVDIGCEGWAWSKQFKKRKHVYGYGPQEKREPRGFKLFRVAVGPCNGEVILYGTGDAATCQAGIIESGEMRVPMESLARVIERHRPISVLKMNVERMEYAMLAAVGHPVADQLAVSFHDRRDDGDAWRKDWTRIFLNALSQWYYPIVKIHGRWNWWLMLAKDYRG